ncbi:MAG: IPT/TIG domain-containing protein [Bacteroidota bacterium]
MKTLIIFSCIFLLLLLSACEEPDRIRPQFREIPDPPEFTSFSPLEGQVEDTVLIIGENFELNSAQLRVFFGEKEAQRDIISEDTISCIVPKGMDGHPVSLRLAFEGGDISSEESFTHLSPIIERLSTNEGSYDEIISLEGLHFHPNLSRNKVYFNEFPASIISASKNKIECKVPLELEDSISFIRLEIENTEDSFEEAFIIPAPEINSLSQLEVKIGEIVIIEGAHFHPSLERNTVWLGDSVQEIISSSVDRLEVKIRDQAFANRKQGLSLKVSAYTSYFQDSLYIKDNWIRRVKLPQENSMDRIDPSIAFSVNGEAFIGLSVNRISKLFYQFDPERATFERRADYAGDALLGAAFFIQGNSAYVGMGELQSGYTAREGYIYEPEFDQWMTMPTCPSPFSDMIGFSIGDKGYYLGKGFGNSNFWEYDLNSLSWTSRADFPVPSDNRDIFGVFGTSYQGKGYLVTARGDQDHIWEYDPVQNAWSMLSLLPFPSSRNNPLSRTTAFELNGFIYVLKKDISVSYFYRFDLQSNSWTDLSHLDYPLLFSTAKFSLATKAYFVSPIIGDRFGELSPFIWEFDPNP